MDTFTTPLLLQLIEGGRLDATPFATHRFQLEETMEAYDVFGDAANTQALKVVLSGLPVRRVLPDGGDAGGRTRLALRRREGLVRPHPPATGRRLSLLIPEMTKPRVAAGLVLSDLRPG